MAQTDPVAVPMIFLRVGWMDHYEGLSGTEGIVGGSSYVFAQGSGHEISNFRKFQNRVCGYAQPPVRIGSKRAERIALTKLGAESAATSLSGVLVVWVSTRPKVGGGVVAGGIKMPRSSATNGQHRADHRATTNPSIVGSSLLLLQKTLCCVHLTNA